MKKTKKKRYFHVIHEQNIWTYHGSGKWTMRYIDGQYANRAKIPGEIRPWGCKYPYQLLKLSKNINIIELTEAEAFQLML